MAPAKFVRCKSEIIVNASLPNPPRQVPDKEQAELTGGLFLSRF
jgi:hypothetical protein